MSKQIHQLVRLITESAAALDKICSTNGTKIPSLTEPFFSESEAFRDDPAAAKAANIIGAAALQLATTILPPQLTLYSAIGGQWHSAALRVCLESNVTEILQEAGPDGMHVDHIAAKNGIDAQKLGRCLRLLTIQHIYREVSPNVFTNTRISSLLDTMKPSEVVMTDPEHKHDNTGGLPALSSFLLDEFFKSSAYLWEGLTDPKTAKSGHPAAAPIAKAVSDGKGIWEFYNQPGQEFRRRRFDIGMRGVHATLSSGIVLQAYDWKSLPNNALIVDVGGGVGTTSMVLSQEYDHLRFVIQDSQKTVGNGVQAWEKIMPGALASGRVKFEVHDFLEPQPQTNASIFLLKHILHNWSDEYSMKILQQLRNAATPQTKIVCMDAIVPYGCRMPADAAGGIPGAAPVEAPEPLVPHWGLVGQMTYHMDMSMMIGFNSSERTIDQFDELFKRAGWRITRVRRPTSRDAVHLAAIEAVPS